MRLSGTISYVEFRILGPLEVLAGGRVVALETPKPRALLAILLLHANEPVSPDRLIEDLWAGRPPPTAAQNLRTYVFQLRKAIGRAVIRTAPSGYELRAEPASIDVHRFEELLNEARAEPPPAAAETLREALALWRGPPLAEFAYETWARVEIARLEELRVEALEERIDADLALGRAARVVAELEGLVAQHPLRERLRAQLMLALYRCGRQADALAAFRDGRRALVDELGIEPGPALRELERAMLDQDPALDLSSAAAAAPGAVGSTSLRRRPTSFVGRTRELREIRTLLEEDDLRLLTLAGAAGSGKTRLALEATAGLEVSVETVLVELAPISDASLVAGTIADALGVPERPGRTRVEALIVHLRHRRMLIVLDNFEQVLAAAPLLQELLAEAASVKLLITSRTPLGVHPEQVYPVPPLELPDSSRPRTLALLRRTEAIKLYCERARDARPSFRLTEANASAVADLCIRLDGLPLALELAAARSNVLSPRALLERMGGRLDLLRAAPGSGPARRHQTLRAAIEWSYDLLTPDRRELFTSLGVFVGGFTVEGAEAVAGDLGVDVLDGLQSLLRDNLLTTQRSAGDEPRVGILETIREYALEELRARGDYEAVRRRHALHFAALAEAAEPGLLGPEQLEWLERLDEERDNIRAALTWATASGESDLGLRIAASLWRYWNFRNHEREARERLEELLAHGTAAEPNCAMAQSAVASLAQWQGDLETVRRMCEASLPVHRRVGNNRWVVLTLGLLTTSALARGDIDEARTLSREEIELARKTRDRLAESYALAHVSMALAAAGELDDAENALEEAVRLARKLGNLRSVGHWGMTLAGFALLRRDHARAHRLFEESLGVHRRLCDARGIPLSLLGLTYLALEADDPETARRLLAKGLALDRENDDQPVLANHLEMSGRLAAARGHLEHAVELYAGATMLRESAGAHLHEVWWWFWWPDPTPHIAELRSKVGDGEFKQAWARGRAMTVQEAIDEAIEEIRSFEPGHAP
jgi:predicted ATPase/DNA-binding SARP family transcriptional activator